MYNEFHVAGSFAITQQALWATFKNELFTYKIDVDKVEYKLCAVWDFHSCTHGTSAYIKILGKVLVAKC